MNAFIMDTCTARTTRAITVMLLPVFVSLFFGAAPAFGQNDPPEDLFPPPISIISDQEQEQLESEDSVGDRTKLALEFMEQRLKQSESLAEREEFEISLEELGFFRALMDDTLAFLLSKNKRKPSFKNLKRFEMTLKDFIPRLELVRRNMPYKFGYHVSNLIVSVRDTREKSMEPFFSDTVIPDGL